MPRLNKPLLILIVLSAAFALSACATPQKPATPPSTTIKPSQNQLSPTALDATPATAAVANALPTATPTVVATGTDTPIPTITPTPLPLIPISGCGDITQPGHYQLQNDIASPADHDCFTVMSHNVVFDCDHHTIEGNTRDSKDNQYRYYAFFVHKFGFAMLETPMNIEIENCNILHQRTGIFIGGANNVYVHDNVLSNNLNTVDSKRFGIFLGMTEGGGLRLDTVNGGRVENNTANHEAIGIDIRDSDAIIVRNNTASGNSAWGISLLNTSHSQVLGNAVSDNIRYCQWGNGTIGRGCDAGGIILHDGASHNVVAGNTVTGENGNGIFIKAHGSRCGDDNLIENNKIIDAVYNAIEFSFCDHNRVIGNEITGSYDAVFFGFSTNTEIRGNVIRNMTNHGIISANSHGSVVADNQIINAREGVYFYWASYDLKQFYFLTPTPDNYASRDNAIANNLLRDNSVAGIHLLNSTQNQITDNTFANNGKNVWIEGKNDGDVVSGLYPCRANCPLLALRAGNRPQ